MKQIFKNQYLESISFKSNIELNKYITNSKLRNGLNLNESFGDYFYCYLFRNSLTSDNEFYISFSTDEKEKKLNLLFWDFMKIYILDTGVKVYFIRYQLTILKSLDITSSLVGLYMFLTIKKY